MKLNFRNVETGTSLAHGVTPVLIPPPSITRVNRDGYDIAPSTEAERESRKGDAPGITAEGRNRRCGLSFGTGVLYLLGIGLMLSLPFVVPVAVSHAVRIVDGHGFGRDVGVRDALGKGSDAVEKMPVAAVGDPLFGAVANKVGLDGMKGRRERGLIRERVEDGERRGSGDDWSGFAVVRHGKLYLAETFENRLNSEVAGVVARRHPELFGDKCKGGEVSFSFKNSPGIEAEIEMEIDCNGATCAVRPVVDDVRRLVVHVGEGGRDGGNGHYVRAEGVGGGRGVEWGPLAGRLRVRLREETGLAVRRICGEGERVERIVNVGDVMRIMREDGGKVDFSVFRYDGHPRHHIGDAGQGWRRGAGRPSGEEQPRRGRGEDSE